jgi:hypothetical protein
VVAAHQTPSPPEESLSLSLSTRNRSPPEEVLTHSRRVSSPDETPAPSRRVSSRTSRPPLRLDPAPRVVLDNATPPLPEEPALWIRESAAAPALRVPLIRVSSVQTPLSAGTSSVTATDHSDTPASDRRSWEPEPDVVSQILRRRTPSSLFQSRRDRQLADIQTNVRALEDEATEMRRVSRRFPEGSTEFRALRQQAAQLQTESSKYSEIARTIMNW